jgi:DNA-binding MarR family transcriptional regulator
VDQQIRSYRRALRQFQRLVGVQMKSCSCSVSLPQCLILLELDEHGQMTMSQLAAALRLDHSTLSRTVDGLVRNKLIARLRDESDRRLVWVRLTDHGARTCADIHLNNDAYCASVFDNIPLAERVNVLEAFESLVQAYLMHEKSAEKSGSPVCATD